ncbi:hypothetical protein PHYSODRAFT_381063, partial [Phytophthora sojae]
FDGACRHRSTAIGAAPGAGATLFAGTVNKWTFARYLDSTTHTNNTAEYIALISGLTGALHHGVRRLTVKGDSTLILEQVRGRYACNNARLRQLRNQARRLLRRLDYYELVHVDRLENRDADRLANRALD